MLDQLPKNDLAVEHITLPVECQVNALNAFQ
jgi:hypothetical protein